jgi:hypothetical protein
MVLSVQTLVGPLTIPHPAAAAAVVLCVQVVDNRTTTDSGVANELLAQFNNVAYFKNEEDDATFWNRLISVDDRAALEQEQHTELLPRAARLKPEERAALGLQGDSGDSDQEGEEGGGSGSKKAGAAAGAKKARPRARAAVKRDAASGEPGPPVDGAALRVDEWLLDVGPDGRPLKQVRGWDSCRSHLGCGLVSKQDCGCVLGMLLATQALYSMQFSRMCIVVHG